MEKVQFSVRLPKELVAQIDKQAKKETRTRTNMLEHIITQYIKRRK